MSHKITLPLPKGWEVEQELILEENEEVVSYYATPSEDADPASEGASIELYVGETPPESDAKIECINSYMEAIGLEEGEEIPVREIPFIGQPGWYYDAEDDDGCPVILICVESAPGTLVMAILAHRDEESLDELLSYVDENLSID